MEQPPGFEPSATFKGARLGYVFTTGPSGTGYYLDRASSSSQAGRTAATGTAAAATEAAGSGRSAPLAAAAEAGGSGQSEQQRQGGSGPGPSSSGKSDSAAGRAAQHEPEGERSAGSAGAAGSGGAGGSAGAAAAAKPPPVLSKANNPFLKHLAKGKKGLPIPAAAAGGDAKRARKDEGPKPVYLQEMERYREMSCSSEKTDRPLVK